MKRIVIANFYPVWPPVGGGQRRIFFLARELSKSYDVEIIVPERSGEYRVLELGPQLKEIAVPTEKSFRAAELAIDKRVRMAADLAYALHWDICKTYQKVLSKRLDGAAAAVTAHPYSIYALLDARGQRKLPLVFDSQNVELQQKRAVLGSGSGDLDKIEAIERTALSDTALTIACSSEDAQTFGREYGADPKMFKIAENGVDALGVPAVRPDQRLEIRRRLGLDGRFVAVFGGSYHHPNFRAVDCVLAMARALPDVIFMILGTVCKYEVLKGDVPENVRCLGAVSEDVKWLAFSIADAGLNPMEEGSGTNIKVFEYAAAGLPVITSNFGARGIGFVPGEEMIVTENAELQATLNKLSGDGHTELAIMGEKARRKVLATADWSVIGKRYREAFDSLLG